MMQVVRRVKLYVLLKIYFNLLEISANFVLFNAMSLAGELVLKMKCDAGHVFHWSSSPVIRNAKQNSVYKVNLDFASDLLFSGNNYYKIHQFCRFVGVECISPSTYFAYQRIYLDTHSLCYLLCFVARANICSNMDRERLLFLGMDAATRLGSVQSFAHTPSWRHLKMLFYIVRLLIRERSTTNLRIWKGKELTGQ